MAVDGVCVEKNGHGDFGAAVRWRMGYDKFAKARGRDVKKKSVHQTNRGFYKQFFFEYSVIKRQTDVSFSLAHCWRLLWMQRFARWATILYVSQHALKEWI